VNLQRTFATAKLDFVANLRRPLYWVLLIILGLLSWLYADGSIVIESGDATTGGDKSFISSEFAIANWFSVLSLLVYGFFLAVAAGMPLLQDRELKITELLHATPLTPREYVLGKFIGIACSMILIFMLHVVMTAGLIEIIDTPSRVGEFSIANYAWPTIAFILPTFLFLSGVCFWVGGRFGKPILVFLIPVAVFFACTSLLWNWAPSWLDPQVDRAMMWLDPVGRRWLLQTYLVVDRGVEFYNNESIPFDATFWMSRSVYALIGLLAILRTSVGIVEGRPRTRARKKTKATDVIRVSKVAPAPTHAAIPAPAPVSAPLADLAMTARPPGFLNGTLLSARVEFRELRTQPGLYLFIPLILLVTSSMVATLLGPFETPLLATPGVLATRTLGTLTTMTCLLLLFYTVESLRREQGTGFAPIAYSTPLRTGSLLLGKAIANSFVGFTIVLANLAVSIGVILYQGTVSIDLLPFGLVWGVLLSPTLLFWCSLVMALYSITRNRYTTYAVALGLLIWTANYVIGGDGDWRFNWPLWGSLLWTDMGVFELDREALFANRLLLLCASFFLIALTVRLFPRRELDGTRVIHRIQPKPLALSALKLAPSLLPFLVVWFTLGNMINDGFQGKRAEGAGKRYWSRNVATFTDSDLPDILRFDGKLSLYPETRSLESSGTLTLVNNNEAELFWIALSRGVHWLDTEWTLDGESVVVNDREGLVLLTLQHPMAPGDTHDVGFTFNGIFPSGITKNGGAVGAFVLPSGVVLRSFADDFIPVIGFQQGRGVDEDNASDSREYPIGHHQGITPPAFGSGRAFPMRLEVNAPEEYTINGVGEKTEDLVEDGTRKVVWESDHPVRFFNVICGRWTEVRGVGTAIYHHPEHDYNIDEMLEALDGSRKWYSEWFMPYPWGELKLSEFPGIAGYAQGFPTNITFSESIGFLTRSNAEAQAAFMVTAHEAAHQWWGNLLLPGRGPGGNILSEGMAHFSTIMLTGQLHGERERIELCKRFENQYSENRTVDSERELVLIDGSRPGDQTVTYEKSGWVFWMLQQLMGREQNLAGLQSFISHYQDNPDHPLLEDFLDHMRPFAPDIAAYDAFTEQWFRRVVIPEFVLNDVRRSSQAAAGAAGARWEVTGTLENRGSGLVQVDILASRGESSTDDTQEASDEQLLPPDYSAASVTLTIGEGETVNFVIPCNFEPERVIVDPSAFVLQLRRAKAFHSF
jgi:ABC-2 type transport system permease protein